jgi:hypothetical protein
MRRNIGSRTWLRIEKADLDAAGTDEATITMAQVCSWRLVLEDRSADAVVLARPLQDGADTGTILAADCIVLTDDDPSTPIYPTTEDGLRVKITTGTATVRVEWESQERPA